jgi:hypothetical protein
MPGLKCTFRAPLWRYKGAAAWHFVTLPKRQADEVRDLMGGGGSAFGSLRVTARIGGTRWDTSIFPSREHASYLLPVKAQVRKAEAVQDGDLVAVELSIRA